MKKMYIKLSLVAFIPVIIFVTLLLYKGENSIFVPKPGESESLSLTNSKGVAHPMSIEKLRTQEYPGSNFVIEQKLANGTNYKQYVVSYLSEGLKIYGLLTVPNDLKPEKGYPAIVFVHGYIPPKQYVTTKNYATYQAALAKHGFITFKPDLRGHGRSEGEPVTAHFSEKYVVDTLNAISSLKKYEDVDPKRIGYWGHSNGGEIGLRALVINSDIKVASLWAGVVGSFEDMLETYNSKIPFLKDADDILISENGLPSSNQEFWQQIDPYYFLDSVSVPVQLQHGTGDKSVPVELSLSLKTALEKQGKQVEYFEYRGDDHNIKNNYSKAWQRTVDFYKLHL